MADQNDSADLTNQFGDRVTEQEMVAIRCLAAVFVQTETAETREGAHKKALVRAAQEYLAMRVLTRRKPPENLCPPELSFSLTFVPQKNGETVIQTVRGGKPKT